MDKAFTIKITGGGYNIDDRIDKIQLGRILSIVTSNDNASIICPSNKPTYKRSAKKRTNFNFSLSVLVRKEIEDLNLDPISSLYGNYWDVKAKSDRIMWILAVLSENKFDSINQKEISFIAEKFGDNIPTKSITSLLDSHKKNSRIVPSLMDTVRTIRILKPGLDYVKNLQTNNLG